MKHLKLFEDFKQNEPAVINKQLKEIDKLYNYFFTYDEKLNTRFSIDTTGIVEKQGLNYWYYINLFEEKNEVPLYYWKIYINITLNDLLMPNNKEAEELDAAEAGGDMAGGDIGGDMAGGEEMPIEETPIPEEEETFKYEEEAEEDVEEEAPIDEEPTDEEPTDEESDDEEDEVEEPTIENCYIKIAKYDHESGKKLATWEDNAVIEDVLSTDWLVKKIDATEKYTLKVPTSQSDVEQAKKNIKNHTDLHYQ